ncbi:flagellar basal body rod protein FlgB [Litorilituus sediminis]|uniref:Flagellar basal body rod protein FlgB n=1 Tax=Litorilituus sediminis TaxID=718192 RepID=A0A4P6P7V2_9GAMM|nr:flagellar basal body rod protein FlgB [Litorilituus sediminis]QBG37731.1 flagellar basal body rod protein FlgB [Litorilituus sediminis]
MAIGFDKGFQMHAQGMVLRSQRAEVIASNIANADTPGYKAKGMDFSQAMAQATQRQQGQISKTHEKHFDIRTQVDNSVQYRVPNQPDTGDSNTVDVQVERNLYLENSLEYQASVQFLNGKIKAYKKVISGGQ